MQASNEASPQVFRRAWQLRLVVWGVFALLAVATGASALRLLLGQTDRTDVVWRSLILGLAVLALYAPWSILPRYALVTRDGIRDRGYLRWRLWSWDEFASGRVRREGNYYVFVFPGRRPSVLSLHQYEDRDRLLSICRSRWVPATVAPPETLTVPVGGTGPGATISCDNQGIRVRQGREERQYAWSEVRRLTVFQVSHEHSDFLELVLDLPDRSLNVFTLGGHEKYGIDRKLPGREGRRVTPAAAKQFLLGHVPAERTRNYADYGPAQSPEELDLRLERGLASFRGSIVWKSAVMLVFFGGAFLFVVNRDGLAAWTLLNFGGAFAVLLAAFWLENRHRTSRLRRNVETERKRLAQAARPELRSGESVQ